MNTIQVNYTKTHSDAVEPTYAKDGDAGLDLTAISKEDLGNNMTKFNFGLAFEIPKGYMGCIYPRSSSYKTGQQLTNCVGVIDSGYRGEISAIFHKNRSSEKSYEAGDRIAQLIIQEIPKVKLIAVQKLSKTDRGSGGYGSTGN